MRQERLEIKAALAQKSQLKHDIKMQRKEEYDQQMKADFEIDVIRYSNQQEREKLMTKNLLAMLGKSPENRPSSTKSAIDVLTSIASSMK